MQKSKERNEGGRRKDEDDATPIVRELSNRVSFEYHRVIPLVVPAGMNRPVEAYEAAAFAVALQWPGHFAGRLFFLPPCNGR